MTNGDDRNNRRTTAPYSGSERHPTLQLTPEQREKIPSIAESVRALRSELAQKIVGQDLVVSQVLAALLAEGHCLMVGVPGLAKTLLISAVADLISLDFKRIQFTPDLMPTDITGSTVIRQDKSGRRDFHFMRGPIFANLILADEINRTPPKTQAALMEAMEERQISGGGRQLSLERPFFVLATQNPIEQKGTYPLPVSQLDRFLFNIDIDYPTTPEEFRILVLTTSTYEPRTSQVFERETILEWIDVARRISIDVSVMDYIARLVRATRPDEPSAPAIVREQVSWGAGPRAAQSLMSGARAIALMAGRDHVLFEDVNAIVLPTLRHRIVLSYYATAEGVEPDDILRVLLKTLPDTSPAPLAETGKT